MLKCIIVDDQQQAAQSLKNFIKKVSFLELTAAFTDSKSALDYLKNNPADLIFLDIKKSLVILTATNRKFAMDGFEQGVISFLLKPVLYERFRQAVEKAYKLKLPQEHIKLIQQQPPIKGGYIFIKEATRLVRLELDDIYYVTGLKNYVSIQMKSQRIVSLQTMKQMQEILPSHRFIRVHRSYFVAIDKIISVEKQQIHLKDKTIPIGNIYLPHFMNKLMKKND